MNMDIEKIHNYARSIKTVTDATHVYFQDEMDYLSGLATDLLKTTDIEEAKLKFKELNSKLMGVASSMNNFTETEIKYYKNVIEMADFLFDHCEGDEFKIEQFLFLIENRVFVEEDQYRIEYMIQKSQELAEQYKVEYKTIVKLVRLWVQQKLKVPR